MSNDFSQGKVWKNVINQAIPLMVAQLIQILYMWWIVYISDVFQLLEAML